MYNINLHDELLQAGLNQDLNEINRDFDKTINELEQVLSLYLGQLEYAKSQKLHPYIVLLNFTINLNILLLDNKLTSKYLVNSKTEWEKRYFARTLCILTYEATEDIPELTGSLFKKTLSELNNGNHYLNELKTLSASLHQFKAKHRVFLKNIRNNTFGHREHNSEIQIKAIIDLNWAEIIDINTSFDSILRNYGAFLQRIMANI
ncbi:hypothetical protein [Emticicia aquatilis]|nr:hypothetical protein [Emticicia aquatilis]